MPFSLLIGHKTLLCTFCLPRIDEPPILSLIKYWVIALGWLASYPRGAVVGWCYRADLSATDGEPYVSFRWIGKDLHVALVIEVKKVHFGSFFR